MKTKEEIVANWLPRYTKRSLNDFGEYILLTNFNKYVEVVCRQIRCAGLRGRDANMISAMRKESLLLILEWVVLMLLSLWIC